VCPSTPDRASGSPQIENAPFHIRPASVPVSLLRSARSPAPSSAIALSDAKVPGATTLFLLNDVPAPARTTATLHIAAAPPLALSPNPRPETHESCRVLPRSAPTTASARHLGFSVPPLSPNAGKKSGVGCASSPPQSLPGVPGSTRGPS